MSNKRCELEELHLDEISLVDVPANSEARVALYKSASGTSQGGEDGPDPVETDDQEDNMDVNELNEQLEALALAGMNVVRGGSTSRSRRGQ